MLDHPLSEIISFSLLLRFGLDPIYSFGDIAIFTENGRFAFSAPFGGLSGNVDDHLRLIGKRVVDFLLVLIELFFARCYGCGATSDYRFKIGDFAQTGTG